MSQIWSVVLAALTTLGLGGMAGAFVQARVQRHNEIERREHGLKEARYRCILILMVTKLNLKVGLPKLAAIRPELTTEADVNSELATELLSGVIFASDEVLDALAAFISSPNQHSFVAAAVAMRQDLWGRRSKLGAQFFEVAGVFDALDRPSQPQRRGRVILSRGLDG